jgi:hypothetical protein
MISRFSVWKLAFAALLAAGAVVVYLLFSAQGAEEDWEQFKQSRHCQSVGRELGSNQGGWRCDDGAVHYRWRQQK